MCEQFIAWAAQPFKVSELWEFTERLERYGIAGFGWGAGWRTATGGLTTYRETRAFRDDVHGQATVGAVETDMLLVHLRRPSRLSTLQLPDAQPFADPAGRFVFGHNGDFRDWRDRRAAYRAEGRIQGRADTEVAERWLEDEWADSRSEGEILRTLHESFGGQANLAVLDQRGVTAYAGNTENPLFAFRLGGIRVVSTAIYSLDRSLFRYVAAGAQDRRLVKAGRWLTLGLDAGVVAA